MELKNYFAQDDAGNILSNASCYLYERGSENLVAELWGENGLTLGNPFSTNQKGLVQFAAANGLYDLRVVKGSRDYRIRVQFNDMTETLAAAEQAADRAEQSASRKCQSVSQLQTVVGRYDGDSASVRSFGEGWAVNVAYPFPSGGGSFVWDANSVETPISGMVVQVTGQQNGRWTRLYSGAVDVTWTGAIPDGLAKCSAAVQLAVDNYTAVYFPPGKFVLDKATSHSLVYTPGLVDCGVKITSAQKCVELYGAGESTLLLSEPGVRYLALISMYNVNDRSVHSFNMDGLYDRSGAQFQAAITGIRQQSVRRCTTHSLKISNFAYHCLAMYGGSDAITEPPCLWNKAYNLYLDGGGQSCLLVYSANHNGLLLPNEFNEFSDVFALNSHVYFGVELRKSNNNIFTNLVTNSNEKGGLNLEEGASYNKVTNWVSKYNKYGLHITGNGLENVVGNRISNFDCSENTAHNALAYQGAVSNHFTNGRFSNAVNGNGWRSEDTSSYGNYFNNIECMKNGGEGLQFQNAEYLSNVTISGNTLRGLIVLPGAKLRGVTSKGNGTDVASPIGLIIDAVDCDFGAKHAVLTKEGMRIGQFVEVCKAGRYTSGGVSVTEEISEGSVSERVWKTSVQYGTLVSIPVGVFAASGFTTLKIRFRVKTDGPSRTLRDAEALTNINIPAGANWVYASYDLAISGLTTSSVVKIRYELATGFVIMDGYIMTLV